MYAVIATGGKQFRVEKGDVIAVENLKQEPGSEVVFDRVLLTADNGNCNVGRPIVENTKVVGELVRSEKGDKIIVFKFKKRKKYRRKIGHRQLHSLVKIKAIVSDKA